MSRRSVIKMKEGTLPFWFNIRGEQWICRRRNAYGISFSGNLEIGKIPIDKYRSQW